MEPRARQIDCNARARRRRRAVRHALVALVGALALGAVPSQALADLAPEAPALPETAPALVAPAPDPGDDATTSDPATGDPGTTDPPADPVDPADPSDPADPGEQSDPVGPAPSDPRPADPAPTDPAPVDPAPVDPAPAEPAPGDPAPAAEPPAGDERAPADAAPRPVLSGPTTPATRTPADQRPGTGPMLRPPATSLTIVEPAAPSTATVVLVDAPATPEARDRDVRDEDAVDRARGNADERRSVRKALERLGLDPSRHEAVPTVEPVASATTDLCAPIVGAPVAAAGSAVAGTIAAPVSRDAVRKLHDANRLDTARGPPLQTEQEPVAPVAGGSSASAGSGAATGVSFFAILVGSVSAQLAAAETVATPCSFGSNPATPTSNDAARAPPVA